MMNTIRKCLASVMFGAACLSMLPLARAADGADAPSVTVRAGGTATVFTIAQLKAGFQEKTLKTPTPWSDGKEVSYRGVSLRDLLKDSKLLYRTNVKVVAVDGYSTGLPTKLIKGLGPVVAFEVSCGADDVKAGVCASEKDFRQLTDKDRGPFFLVWPYDKLPKTGDPHKDDAVWAWFVAAFE